MRRDSISQQSSIFPHYPGFVDNVQGYEIALQTVQTTDYYAIMR